MSQSNKTNILMLVFILVCVIITATAIYLTNEGYFNLQNDKINEVKQENIEKPIISDGLGVKTLEDRFTENALTLTEKQYYPKPQEKDSMETYFPIEVHYVQIDGLRNVSIQDRINTEIKETAISLVDGTEMSKYNLRNIYVYAECTANYSNVLSINIYRIYIDKNQNLYKVNGKDYVFIGLNYDLNTENKISFSDLFTNDAGTKNIISQSAYNSFASEYLNLIYEESNWSGDMNEIDYSSIEDRVIKVMQNYSRDNDYQFYFDNRKIYACINNEYINIEMRKFYSQIAIFNRFANSFLKEKNEKKLIFTKDMEDYVAYRDIQKLGDNLFYDVQIVNWTEDKDIDIKKYIQDINKEIDECKAYLNENNASVFSMLIEMNNSSGIGEENEQSNANYIKCKATMSKEYFNKTYLDKVLEWIQTDRYGGDMSSYNLVSFLSEDSFNNKNIVVDNQYPWG